MTYVRDCDLYPGSQTEKINTLKEELYNIHQQVKLPADIELLLKACLTNENLLIASHTSGLCSKYKIQL